jgi:hypothetical protein
LTILTARTNETFGMKWEESTSTSSGRRRCPESMEDERAIDSPGPHRSESAAGCFNGAGRGASRRATRESFSHRARSRACLCSYRRARARPLGQRRAGPGVGQDRMLWTEGRPSSAPRSGQAQRGWRLRSRHLPRSHPGAHSAAQSRWRLLAVFLQRLRLLRECQVFLRARAVFGPSTALDG